jgi:hypothetical protein
MMKKATLGIVAAFAAAAILAAGLALVPTTVQNAEANPCSDASNVGGKFGGPTAQDNVCIANDNVVLEEDIREGLEEVE